MRHLRGHILLAFCTMFVGICAAQQPSTVTTSTAVSVPNLIRYSGTLKDAQGAALPSATTGITFAIYNQQDGGAPIWMETQNVASDATGNYSVLLGSTTTTGLPTDLFSQQEQRWLGIQIEGQAEQPRVLLVSVPYAFKAHEAETLGGLPASAFVQASPSNALGKPSADTGTPLNALIAAGNASGTSSAEPGSPAPCATPITGYIPYWNPEPTLCNSAIFQSGSNIGIGTITPGSPLAVNASTTPASSSVVSVTQTAATSISGYAISAVSNAYTINAVSNDTTGFSGAIRGYSSAPSGFGIFGGETSATGINYGVYGRSASTGGVGVWGSSTSATGSTVGIIASVASANGTAAVLNNAAGGKIISGQNNGVQKFSVDGSGNVNALGTFTGNGSGLTGIQFTQLSGTLANSQLSGAYGNVLSLSNSGNSFGGSFSGSGSGLTGIQFSQLGGTLSSSQFGGTYTNPLTLSSTSNVYYGNGSNLTGIVLGAGSPYYIQNGTALQSGASFNIDGSGSIGGILTGTTAINTTGTYQIGGSAVVSTASPADGNLFVGIGAGTNNTSGQGTSNSFYGYHAGFGNTLGYGNNFFGNAAGSNNTSGYLDVYIANQGPAPGNESNTIRIGDPANQYYSYIAGIYGNVPSGQTFPVVVNSNGQLGTGFGNTGVLSWNGRTGMVVPEPGDYQFPMIEGTVGNSQLSGNYPNLVSLSNSGNTFAGTYSGTYMGNGSGLTGVLPAAGSPNYIQNGTLQQINASFNIDGSGTVGQAFSAMAVNSATNYTIGSGPFNTVLSVTNSASQGDLFVGVGAGGTQPGGLDNTYTGYQAGYSNNAQDNTISGYQAGYNNTGSNNTFYGYEAGGFNGGIQAGGGSNSFFGWSAGSNNTSGSDNIFIGLEAGQSNTGGSNNIFIGSEAGQSNTSGGSNIYIGVGSLGFQESNVIRIGTSGTLAGQQDAVYIAGIVNTPVANTNPVCVLATGQLGACNSSSRRFKDQIADMGDSSSKLFQLRPVSFIYKPQYDDGTHALQYGLIAEEVATIYPEMALYDKDGQPSGVKYQLLAPMLLNELQKQHAVVTAQQDELQTQLQQINTQRQEIDGLKLQLQQQNASLQLRNASLEERLSKLESYVATQTRMQTASDNPPAAPLSAGGNSQ
ncbi:MAG: tail fiber domain-containing protein [Candidatus Korobacteraceae bacterium]